MLRVFAGEIGYPVNSDPVNLLGDCAAFAPTYRFASGSSGKCEMAVGEIHSMTGIGRPNLSYPRSACDLLDWKSISLFLH